MFAGRAVFYRESRPGPALSCAHYCERDAPGGPLQDGPGSLRKYHSLLGKDHGVQHLPVYAGFANHMPVDVTEPSTKLHCVHACLQGRPGEALSEAITSCYVRLNTMPFILSSVWDCCLKCVRGGAKQNSCIETFCPGRGCD